ncbi:hypothetical protein AJ79_07233 [Helicocarpus griseus UAMH5409]|uniref:DUF7587 domain-containing protein n=1 Tax=Helicocarpus griseus UAMH5409 TaxID=1447875 RepID=A0A2B7X566_9EURO|nr:hypothetical protein AJ79_07233 [Helicocarpus griseus UAMH5409]
MSALSPSENNRIIFEGHRVEDDTSRAFYQHDLGIVAESNTFVPTNPTNTAEYGYLKTLVMRHLDWDCRIPSPFISVYGDCEHAEREAERRARQGRHNVVLREIIVTEDDLPATCYSLQWLFVPELLEDVLGCEVPDFVGGNADPEFLFVHHIPKECVCGFRWYS